MADIKTIRARLEKRILESGHTFREVSLKIGRKDSYIHQYVKYGLPKRLNEVDRKKLCLYLGMDEKELLDDELLKSVQQLPAAFENEEINGTADDFVNIDICAASPHGRSGDNVIGRMSLNYLEFGNWLPGNPFNLKILRLEGDYMEPTLPNGCLIIYDTGCRDYNGDGLYILRDNKAAQLRRLQKTGADNYTLSTDNPHYQDVCLKQKDMEILGRAVYCLSGRQL